MVEFGPQSNALTTWSQVYVEKLGTSGNSNFSFDRDPHFWTSYVLVLVPDCSTIMRGW